MRQEMMILQLKLSAAEDELARRKAATDIITKQVKLEASASQAFSSQNIALRERISRLQKKLQDSSKLAKETRTQLLAAVAERDAQLQQLQERLQSDSNHAQSELDAAQALVSSLRSELALAEKTATAAQERASLAEQTLQQREALASERAQMHSDMQNYSQGLAKMALETGTAVNAKVLAETQSLLGDERSARTAAEARAAAAEGRAAQLEKQVSQLEGHLEWKGQRVARLEEALQQRENATPAGHRGMHAALHAVDALVSQLDNSPESEMPHRRAPAMSLLGKITKDKENGKKAAAAGRRDPKAKELPTLQEVSEGEEDVDMDLDVAITEEKTKKERKPRARKSQKESTKALPQMLSGETSSDDDAADPELFDPSAFFASEASKGENKKEKKQTKKGAGKAKEDLIMGNGAAEEEESLNKKGGRKAAAPARQPRGKATAAPAAAAAMEKNDEEMTGAVVPAARGETKRKRKLLGGVKNSQPILPTVDAMGEDNNKVEEPVEEMLPKAKKNKLERSSIAPKLDLDKVWGDGDNNDAMEEDILAISAEDSITDNKSKKNKKEKADKGSFKSSGEASKENNVGGGNELRAVGALGEHRMLEKRPLGALNPASVAAAANQIREVPPPLKPVAARPLLGVSGAGGKRRLLGVSSGAAMGPGGLMTTKLIGNNFTVPKLQGK